MERDASRSYLMFTITVSSVDTSEQGSPVLVSRLQFVEMAGSEYGFACGKGQAGLRVKSIASLHEVLASLVQNQGQGRCVHGYRSSNITRLLTDALGGTAALAVIATCSPAHIAAEETRRTLHFAQLAKGVVCWPVAAMLNRKDFWAMSKTLAGRGDGAETLRRGWPNRLLQATSMLLDPLTGWGDEEEDPAQEWDDVLGAINAANDEDSEQDWDEMLDGADDANLSD
eukprot:gnl/TRDRNA2_/TRDRNA2_133955_c2_seq1.p1 gnl/TRDRNA2_/TRDRNA2_133955_c2~~gnl/TRDRNA2_/TRDRNA2_133955_c2_seq1.p1  ORF type:complete len:235 (+),score=44.32 gnl/TRDRNA2_/TRDRNA2_133955_c2_seq1:22-705(+)